MLNSFQAMSGKRLVDTDVLFRLAAYDFLVKFGQLDCDDDERVRYQALYDHVVVTAPERVRQFELKKIADAQFAI
jgi:hypothetical protein